jgi:hypothetical protein
VRWSVRGDSYGNTMKHIHPVEDQRIW